MAVMAVETGIPPQALLEAPPGMLEAMHDYMVRRNTNADKG